MVKKIYFYYILIHVRRPHAPPPLYIRETAVRRRQGREGRCARMGRAGGGTHGTASEQCRCVWQARITMHKWTDVIGVRSGLV